MFERPTGSENQFLVRSLQVCRGRHKKRVTKCQIDKLKNNK